jgi:outer membrane receptor protein involved in Fe transport
MITKKTLTIFVAAFFLFPLIAPRWNDALAGVTGTIAGTVMDKERNEPLQGANVVILETTFGTIVNPDGFFLINNVPPGIYKVRASMMGYVSETRENVRIRTDLRTTLDFALSSTVLELDEITVSAEQDLIQKDITSSTHFVSASDLEHKPVRSFQEVVDIQPGVAAGHFRGGRKSEVIYLVDGIPIQEAIEGAAGSEIPQNAITEVSIQTGGFNAEYGRAMSGVVNLVTKDGGSEHHGQLIISSDRMTGHKSLFDGDKIDDENYYELFLGGPINHSINYLLSWNLTSPHARWRREVLGYRTQVFANLNSNKQNALGKVSYRFTDALKLNFQGLISVWDWTEYEHWWFQSKGELDGLPPQSKKSYQVASIFTHTLSPQTFYTLKLSQFFVLKSVFGKGSLEYQYPFETTDQGLVISGDKMWWQDHKEVITTAKLEGTSQITPHHQFKGGLEFVYYYLYLKDVQHDTIKTEDPRFPQYNIFDTEYHYYPKEGSIYLQDKIEYLGMVANLGLRYDFFDPTTSRPAVEQYTAIDDPDQQEGLVVENRARVPAILKDQFSPRLGVSIAITEEDQIHLNYGYFFQMPSFKYLYTNLQYKADGFSPLAGNPDLKPSETIAFEAGYKHRFADAYLFNITVFNKDVSNLVDTKTYLPEDQEDQVGYTQYVNMAHVNIHGMETYLEKRYGDFFTGKISYTYMMAQGTGSSEREGYDWLSKGHQVPIGEYFLSWDQRHKFVVDADFRKEHNWGVSLLWQWNSPLPYTKDTGFYTQPNGARMEATNYLDLKINKEFSLSGIRTSFLLELRNALDAKNILWVDSEGTAGGTLHDPGAYDLERRIRFGIEVKF